MPTRNENHIQNAPSANAFDGNRLVKTELNGRRVLITGAGGFIGSHLVKQCVLAGAHVVGVSRESVAPAAFTPGVEWEQADLTNQTATEELLAKHHPSLIFHLAGFPSASRHLDAVGPTLDSNLLTSISLMRAAVQYPVERIVLAGSLETNATGDAPSSAYAASKAAMVVYARMFHKVYRLPVSIARTFMVFGPGQKDELKLVPYVITQMIKRENVKLSSGGRLVDWVYVEDVARGFITLALSKGLDAQEVEIGSGKLLSVREIVTLIARLLEYNLPISFGALADRPAEEERIADVESTFRLIGWRPNFSLETGLQLTIQHYLARTGISTPAM